MGCLAVGALRGACRLFSDSNLGPDERVICNKIYGVEFCDVSMRGDSRQLRFVRSQEDFLILKMWEMPLGLPVKTGSRAGLFGSLQGVCNRDAWSGV